MNAIRRGLAEINGASLSYELAGAGPALVMLHGHLMDSRQWDGQFAAFSVDHTVVRYDARGFGTSTQPAAPFSHAADLRALLDFLAIDHAVLMGCSNGGSTCLDFTLLNPSRVDGLILVDSSLGGYQPTGPMPTKVVAFTQARQRGDVAVAVELALQMCTDGARREPGAVNPAARERSRAIYATQFARPLVPEAVAEELTPPAIERLNEIRAPTLAIVGGEDDPMFQDIAGVFTARILGAKSVMIPDACHHPNLEQPESFNEIVARFLSPVTHD